ncbi:DUF1501 domain-containing protein [Ideonella sp. A 288]|uniref:DUF1501 domain-containing protein n=1 Tax=Ideonella sp. A 288 TaxID=1962181 RepID=UPI000B4BC198|nr:DUF1501 domain-containing protein [Ideonella sp. A 288]
MHIINNASRRAFLRQAGAMTALVGGGAAPLALNLAAMGSAAAATPGGYRAIVCLFLYGGNDAFNMVLPTDAASWNAYSATRTQAPDPIALLAAGTPANAAAALGSPARLGGVLPVLPARPQGRTFALHPLLGAIQTLFDTDKRLAIVPNIGPLIMPTTKAQYALSTWPRPARLFSHNDQQNTWQALGPEGTTRGWAGRMGDLVASQNTRPVFTAVSATGNSVWLAGNVVQQYQVNSTGAIPLGVNSSGQVYGSLDVGAALQRLATTTRTAHPFDADVAAVARRSIDAEQILRTALRPASDPTFGTAPASGAYNASNDPKLRYVNPLAAVAGTTAANSLAQQFQVVARMIDAGLRGATGASRQVFFVSVGGFDTHDQQNRNQADLMARVAQAMQYFDITLGNLGARDKVTTFTASDFGRTFTSNGDGTDHGWGAHHFVMGGAVNGGDLFGRFPTLGPKNTTNNNFDSSPDQLGNGSLLPEISVDQLGNTLGRWFGLSDAELLGIFPNLANFDLARRDLGFFRPA